MANPFENPDGTFLVLVNEQGQHSLWPVFAAVPAGWAVTHGPAGREDCLGHVRRHWTDTRPRGLAAHLDTPR
ncbi:MbtH family protein [Streptosporangium sp. NPDC020072]|uniref:MbtH family protein n=1 Tax=Streptosporangium sp. NPDC020072 TaxID=3154788 RepID=UPI003414CCE3